MWRLDYLSAQGFTGSTRRDTSFELLIRRLVLHDNLDLCHAFTSRKDRVDMLSLENRHAH